MGTIYKEIEVLERILEGSKEPSNLSFSVLKHITDNFRDELKVGRGGCGEVYMGILRNGIVAVKKLCNTHTMEDKEFNHEAQSMIQIDHENIIRLIGYCSHTEQIVAKMGEKIVMAEMRERLLCLEYMINGSLDEYVTDELRGLEWHTRYNIINGICKGLNHLHQEKRIIHMDLKPANILLDEHMVPKIADFGLSRPDEMSHTTSEYRLLTLGYCAPEYQNYGKMSSKSDIYSLGVIIAELVTGSRDEPDITNVLRRWKHRWAKSCKQTLLEHRQVIICIELAQKCKRKDPVERPSICDILNALSQKEIASCNTTEADQVICCLDDMLGIEPLELHFPFERNKEMSCSLKLTNDTNNYYAFRIQTTSLLQYCIQPDKEVIPPRSSCSITITLQAQEQAPEVKHWMEELSVHSKIMPERLTAMDITEHVFNEKAGKVVDKVNLTILFDDESLLPEESSLHLLINALRAVLVNDAQSYRREAKVSDDAEARASDDASSLVDQLRSENASLFKQLTDTNQRYTTAVTDNRILKSDVKALRVKVKLAEDVWRSPGRSPELSSTHTWVSPDAVTDLDLPGNDTWFTGLPPTEQLLNSTLQSMPSNSEVNSIGGGASVDVFGWDPHADGGLSKR